MLKVENPDNQKIKDSSSSIITKKILIIIFYNQKI